MSQAQRKVENRRHEPQTLELQRRFAATPERVFSALTDARAIEAWYGPEEVQCGKVEQDLRAGGTYRLVMTHKDGTEFPLSGTYVDIDPPRRLVMTWTWGAGELAGQETLVALELVPDGDGTLLKLTHENLDGIEVRDHHGEGWNGSFNCLERYLAQP